MVNNKCGFQTEDKKCGFAMPDSMVDCFHKGIETECTCYIPTEIAPVAKKVIEGVGQDAEIVVNEKGGKQSKSPMAMHLVDPNFLIDFARNKAEELEYEDEGESTCVDDSDIDQYNCYRAIEFIGNFMLLNSKEMLQFAMDSLDGDLQQVIRIAKVLQFGADKYKANNWRLIPQEEHLNHALIHLMAALAGDTQDDHIDHALCRLMMAYATNKSDNFEYGAYVA